MKSIASAWEAAGDMQHHITQADRGMDIVLERYGLTTRTEERERWREEEMKREDEEETQNHDDDEQEDNKIMDEEDLTQRIALMPSCKLKSSLLESKSDPASIVLLDLSGEDLVVSGGVAVQSGAFANTDNVAILAYVLTHNDFIESLA